MKSEFTKKKFNADKYFIECSCGGGELLIFERYPLDDELYEPEITVYISSNPYIRFFERVKKSFKYIFFKEYNWISDNVLIDKDNIKQLEEWINEIKK
jgi:hypothetical protein